MDTNAELARLRADVNELKLTLLFAATACEPELINRFGARTVLGVIQQEAEKTLKSVANNEIGNDNAEG